MLDDELRKQAREWAEQSAVEQGLPPRVEDPVVLRQVAQLMGLDEPESPKPE
jgi:hypothetical protein